MQQLTGKPEVDILNLYDQYIALRRELEDMLYHLDSDNIREINAEIVNVFNLNADNIVAGTIDAEVIDVVNINADNITAGTLTGITVQTGISGKDRIVLNKNGIRSYNEDNDLHGIYYDPASIYAQFRLYHEGSNYFEIERLSGGLYMYAFNTPILLFYDLANLTQPLGDWDFSYCDMVYGFKWSFIYDNPFDEYYPSSFAPATGSNKYVKTNGAQNLQIQAFSDRIEVKLGTADWETIYFD